MKKWKNILIPILTIPIFIVSVGCSKSWKYIPDFHRLYKYELPFENNHRFFGGEHYFDSGVSLQGMAKSIRDSGQVAEVVSFEFGYNLDTYSYNDGVFITLTGKKYNGYAYILQYGENKYYVSVMQLLKSYQPTNDPNNVERVGYGVYFIPQHIVVDRQDTDDDDFMKLQINEDFEFVAGFYGEDSGMDATIDLDNKTISYASTKSVDYIAGKQPSGASQFVKQDTTILMQFYTDQQGQNFVDIKAL